jgi:serine/threonine protein kinase
VAKGILELNKLGISHKDIKPANIMCNESSSNIFFYDCWVSKDKEYKLCDLGFSKYGSYADTMEFGNLFYMSPELYSKTEEKNDEKVDVWSLGMVLFEMLAGKNYY